MYINLIDRLLSLCCLSEDTNAFSLSFSDSIMLGLLYTTYNLYAYTARIPIIDMCPAVNLIRALFSFAQQLYRNTSSS